MFQLITALRFCAEAEVPEVAEGEEYAPDDCDDGVGRYGELNLIVVDLDLGTAIGGALGFFSCFVGGNFGLDRGRF